MKLKNGWRKWRRAFSVSKKGVIPLFLFCSKNFFRANQRKTEQSADKSRFSNNPSNPSLNFAENRKKNVDICTKMFYIVSYTEYIIILGEWGFFLHMIARKGV